MIPTFVVDLDGTLCDDKERWRAAYPETDLVTYVEPNSTLLDWDLYFSYEMMIQDRVNENLKQMLLTAFHEGNAIIYLTGRPERTRKATEDWLEENGLDIHDALIMRPDGDFSLAKEYKKNALRKFMQDHQTYKFVLGFTDQPVDIEAYNAVGIPGLITLAR